MGGMSKKGFLSLDLENSMLIIILWSNKEISNF